LIRVAGDGPLRERLRQQVTDRGVGECIEFIGHADHVPQLIADAAFLVHTSDKEGCPNVVMEAMATGRAVVATGVGDVPHLIEHGKTGFVVSHDDQYMLTETMATLMTDHNLCARMGKAGRKKAEREFGLERLVSETLAAYRSAGWRDN